MPPTLAQASHLLPSAEDATEAQFKPGALEACTQFKPALVEVKMEPFPAATNWLPSADDAT